MREFCMGEDGVVDCSSFLEESESFFLLWKEASLFSGEDSK